LGHGRDEILNLFRSPFYGGAHAAYTALGEPAIGRIVDESLAVWGTLRWTVQDAGDPQDRHGAAGVNATLKRTDR
jgi:hypothetical protein